MAHFHLPELAFALLCYTAYRIAHAIWRSAQVRRFAKQRNCELPLNLSQSAWPFPFLDGFRQMGRVVEVVKNGGDVLDDWLGPDFAQAETVSRATFDGEVNIFTIEPANLQAMLATQFQEYETGVRRYQQLSPVLGKSIFSSDGSFWEHSRALFRPQFNKEQINDLESTEHASQQLMHAIGPAVDDAGWTSVTELQSLLYNFTLDTASEFLFGESVESQQIAIDTRTNPSSTFQTPKEHPKSTQVDPKRFMTDFHLVNQTVLDRIRFQSFYWLSDGFKFRFAIRRVRNFIEYFVQRAVDSSTSTAEKSLKPRKYNLLSALASQTQDKTELRNQLLAILLAGRDTTSGLLGWCFVRLALHPEIFAKLRSVILREFDPREPITFSQLKGCRYLQHFLNEVLRLHPTVPVNNRVAACDTTLPRGGGPTQSSPVALYKGQVIVFSVYLMHRRRDLWGADALEFRPERWSEQKIPAWQFLPFSGGPRICLGQQYALTEASYLLVRMLQRFDAVAPADRGEMEKMRKGLGLTMWPADLCRVRFHEAK